MSEIQAELQQTFGAPASSTQSFGSVFRTQVGGGLSGPIGGAGRPLSPFGAGTAVQQEGPTALRDLTRKTALDNGLDPDLLDALVQQESGYSVDARSRVGAMGLTQLMPDTAAALGVTNPFDPAQNLDAGAKYLKQQLNRFGDAGQALAAYNAGPNAVVRHGGIPPYPETQNYVRSIMSRVQRVKQATHG